MAEALMAEAVAEKPRNASLTDWIAVAAGALGALLATLDVSITNSALPQIQGQIGATGTEGTWIATGYLMSEIVMIPLAAWLTRVFGLRRFLIGTALMFTAFSMFCGLSSSLGAMIAGRIGQGFAGGAMIPTAQTIVRTRLPPHQLAIGTTMFGMTVILGPLLGPVIGGWLTENINWRWCFFLNLPISIALITLLITGLPTERMNLQRFISADWLGILGLAMGLSSLTVVLEEGQREHWFDSLLIIWLSIATVTGFFLIAVGQLRSTTPILRLQLVLNKSFGSVLLIGTAVGAGIYGTAYLVPQFLGILSGYNAQQSGAIMLLSGIPAFLLMPILPRMLGRYDLRWMVGAGLLLYWASCYVDTTLTTDSVGHDFIWSQLLRGFGQILVMMPLSQLSMRSVQTHEAGDAAGLYNMSRNLGGTIGLALLGVLMDRRSHFHDDMLREGIQANSQLAQDHMASSTASYLAQTGDASTSQLQAFAQLANDIARQASVMAYNDSFYLLGLAMLACLPLIFILKKRTVTR
ncbi:DHA2 family efflux MFS transporter permease subunit [Pseudomonas fluorescens]|uniref:DHA2 family efflux MFS transporter permease subunit n=1 Tax=Pseudomonas TaxID=286 RepID=UPI001908AF50|nr:MULTISPECIES: DHA2 family efflux MFS transporter permease subunit [Pseudomonas]MBD8092010.1 DHA2 family efflux MFS transporter permease subunit [Pseudomonas fluorescens]MBD8718233.1 DHA2 family efflux MFS transporter permease subunit [Pseudomonas fluorescens]MDL2185492.1 DHA2 family efflux MFS transporter permease subunit [Pseudomonas sp. ChxA]